MDSSFYSCLYSEKTILKVLQEYCNPMTRSANPVKRMKAKRLLSFYGLLTDQNFLNRVREAFSLICGEIDENFPGTIYQLLGRIKALISLINKAEEIEDLAMEKLMEDFVSSKTDDPSQKEKMLEKLKDGSKSNSVKMEFVEYLAKTSIPNPFNRIHDFFAFRLVIEDEKVGDCIDEMYSIANMLLEFFDMKSEFELLQTEAPIETGTLEISPELICVPEKSGVLEKYKKYVKDYVVSPKKDGYQGLHILVHDPVTNRDFEIQIRTRSMNLVADSLANHEYYKQQRYHNRLNDIQSSIDYSKIHVKGFRYLKYLDPLTKVEKEQIDDQVGILYSIPITMAVENFYKLLS